MNNLLFKYHLSTVTDEGRYSCFKSRTIVQYITLSASLAQWESWMRPTVWFPAQTHRFGSLSLKSVFSWVPRNLDFKSSTKRPLAQTRLKINMFLKPFYCLRLSAKTGLILFIDCPELHAQVFAPCSHRHGNRHPCHSLESAGDIRVQRNRVHSRYCLPGWSNQECFAV